MTPSPREVILHIGQHKTGSKALQFFLAANARALAARGIYYPQEQEPPGQNRAYRVSHFRLFALLRRQAMLERGEEEAAQAFGRQTQGACAPFGSLENLLDAYERRMARGKTRKLLISAEDLFDLHTAEETVFEEGRLRAAVSILARLFSARGFAARVVVYLRRQDHLLAAHYGQAIKGSGTNHLAFGDFAARFAPRLRTLRLLEAWAEVFGPERILARPYEPQALPGGIVPDFFAKVLGFAPPAHWRRPALDTETVNRTPSRDFIEFMRKLNQRGEEAQRTFPRAWVLRAALQEPPGAASLSDWFTPEAQKELLDAHEADNQKIAERFAGLGGQPLFTEARLVPGPGGAYAGLTPEKEAAIASRVQRLRLSDRRLRRLWRALGALALLGLLGFFWEMAKKP
ncbi:MAG TPA: hypothetical protein VMU88_00340 [bacterium]|nr:hypothetical protein [bacterium]